MKRLLIILSMVSLNVFAQDGEILKCEPKGINDGGFIVTAHFEDKVRGLFYVKIDQVGYDGPYTKFEGTMSLTEFRNSNKQCVIQLVDNVENKQNIVTLTIGGEDFVQKLKGEDQSFEMNGQLINVLNVIECKGTSVFNKIVNEVCRR